MPVLRLIKNGRMGDRVAKEENCNCLDCGSDNVLDHGEAHDIRDNGENMHVFECLDCGECWKE